MEDLDDFASTPACRDPAPAATEDTDLYERWRVEGDFRCSAA
jgi:hypothetical protein